MRVQTNVTINVENKKRIQEFCRRTDIPVSRLLEYTALLWIELYEQLERRVLLRSEAVSKLVARRALAKAALRHIRRRH